MFFDITYSRCLTAPCLLALCNCISSNFYVFPSSAVLFKCLWCPFATQTHFLCMVQWVISAIMNSLLFMLTTLYASLTRVSKSCLSTVRGMLVYNVEKS